MISDVELRSDACGHRQAALTGARSLRVFLKRTLAFGASTLSLVGGLAFGQAGDGGMDWSQTATAGQLQAQCSQALTQAQRAVDGLSRRAVDAAWLAAYDQALATLDDRLSPISFLSAVHPLPALRSAAEACELRWVKFNAELQQNRAIYRAVQKVKPADDIDRAMLKRLREGFEDAGVALSPAKRQQARRLIDKLSALGQRFDRNIRDEQLRIGFSEAELAGVPAGVWQSAPQDHQGRRVLGTSPPVYTQLMQRADRAATRERMWRVRSNEGGARNLKLLAEITSLRLQYAQLLGADSWAQFVLRRQMAGTPQRASAFLDEVKEAVRAREQRDLQDLREAKARQLQKPLDQVRLERWDVEYYTERVRQARFDVDQEAFRRHFPPQQSLQWAMRLVEKLMGVRYERLNDAVGWHPDVQAYAVKDAVNNQQLATLWLDLFPRDGKYNHAAVWSLRSSASALSRPNQAAFVVNLDRQGLSLDELETVLHELGHAVHNNLSATRYAQLAGTNVAGDFVEAPSQMLEDWVYDRQALNLMAEVCADCPPVPDALLERAREARRFGQGQRYARQHLYASYDLALYGPRWSDPMLLWRKMEGASALGHVAGTHFPSGFSHAATNYGANYYGYLWSLVVATDLRSAFGANRLDAALGKKFRQTVLSQGGQREPAALVRDFLGRDFNPQAFFDELKH